MGYRILFYTKERGSGTQKWQNSTPFFAVFHRLSNLNQISVKVVENLLLSTTNGTRTSRPGPLTGVLRVNTHLSFSSHKSRRTPGPVVRVTSLVGRAPSKVARVGYRILGTTFSATHRLSSTFDPERRTRDLGRKKDPRNGEE